MQDIKHKIGVKVSGKWYDVELDGTYITLKQSFQYDAWLGMAATVPLLLVMSVNIRCAVLLFKQINWAQSYCSKVIGTVEFSKFCMNSRLPILLIHTEKTMISSQTTKFYKMPITG